MNENHPDVDPTPAALAYEVDFALWAEHQIALLRARRFDLLDVDNLIEEVDGTNRSYHRELEHRLFRVLTHLLKCACQPERKSRSWRGTLHEQRYRISTLLEQSPSLDRLVDGYIEAAFDQAVGQASCETGLPRSRFPSTNPYTREQILDPDFVP